MDGSKVLGVVTLGVVAGFIFLVVYVARGCKYAVEHAELKHNAGFVPTVEINPDKQLTKPEPPKPLSTDDIFVQVFRTDTTTKSGGDEVESYLIRVQNEGSHTVSEITLELVFYDKALNVLDRGGEFKFPLKKKLGKHERQEASFELSLAAGETATASVRGKALSVK